MMGRIGVVGILVIGCMAAAPLSAQEPSPELDSCLSDLRAAEHYESLFSQCMSAARDRPEANPWGDQATQTRLNARFHTARQRAVELSDMLERLPRLDEPQP